MKKRHMRLISVCFVGGDGTAGNPYLISTPEQLDAIRHDLSAHYKLINDIEMSEYGNWVPIGEYQSEFKGTLDGNGYAIRNLNVHGGAGLGFFGDLKGTVKNLQMINVDVSGMSLVGGLVAYNFGTIQNTFVTGKVTAIAENPAGLVAFNSWSGKIENTYAAVVVTSENNSPTKGGLVATSLGQVINSYYDQEVSGLMDIGKGIPKSTAEMKQQSTYQCWDFTNRWAIDPDVNDGYPYLKKTPSSLPQVGISSTHLLAGH